MKASEAVRVSAEGKKKADKEERDKKVAEVKARRRTNAANRNHLKNYVYHNCIEAIKKAASQGKRAVSYSGGKTENPVQEGNYLKKLLEKDGYTVEVKVGSLDHWGGSMDIYISHTDYWPILDISW